MSVVLIARVEWRRMFVQPLAWTLLAVTLAVLAYFFLLTLQAFLVAAPGLAARPAAPGATDLIAIPLARAIASLLLLVVPLLGLRALAAEQQSGTLPLLQTAGIGNARIVFGKFLGAFGFCAVLVTLAMLMPLSLQVGTTLDLGRLAVASLGLLMFAAALCAIAVAASAFAQQPAVAAGLALALNLVAWMLDAGARHEGIHSSLINYLALPTHLEPALSGVIASVDVVYFALLVSVALSLATRRLGRLQAG